MLMAHAGRAPRVDPTAWVAPDATVCGDVELGPGVRVLPGARLVGEAGGTIRIGRDCIVMENAVVRASPRHGCVIGDHCLIGPNAHVTGAVLEDQVFVATGAAIFHGAHDREGRRGAGPRDRAPAHPAGAGGDRPHRLGGGRRPGARSCRPTGMTRSGPFRPR